LICHSRNRIEDNIFTVIRVEELAKEAILFQTIEKARNAY
jgi:hypothetical protein